MMIDKEQAMFRIKKYVDAIPFEVGEFGLAQHPFFNTFGTIDLSIKDKDKRLVKIDDSNIEKLKEQRYKLLEKCIDNDDGELTGLFLNIHKPFRIPIFIMIMGLLSKEQHSKILIDLWSDTEFPNDNGINNMVCLFDVADRRYMMNKKEKKVFYDLPNDIIVYRGLQEKAEVRGLSWTLDKDTAIWFATRFKRKGKLIRATIPKSRIYVYKNEREEQEIILNPHYLKYIKEIEYKKPRKVKKKNG